MKKINLNAIYILWLREMKRFLRAKSRIFGMLATPLFFLAFLGTGFAKMPIPGMPRDITYISFLVPGIIGMSMLFTSTFAGTSVLWDREFGFLKEIMVAPVSRLSIILGRIAGSATTSLLQGTVILCASMLMGFKILGIPQLLLSIIFMALISITFMGLGLAIASKIKDVQGFGIIINLIMFPLFFLSGALYPLENIPGWLRSLSYIDPLTYGIDGLRGLLIGASSFSVIHDFAILAGFSLLMILLGTYSFGKSESV